MDSMIAGFDFVDGERETAPHPEDRTEQIRPRAQVGDLAEEFQRVPLFLQRIGRIGFPDDVERLGDDLPFLSLTL